MKAGRPTIDDSCTAVMGFDFDSLLIKILGEVRTFLSPTNIARILENRYNVKAHRDTIKKHLQPLVTMGKVESTRYGYGKTRSHFAYRIVMEGNKNVGP